jgi:heme-degrading monooxygenase HmoA
MIVVLFSISNFFNGLTISTPYIDFKDNVPPEKNVILAISYIEINKSSSELSKFWEHVFLIKNKMSENPGILGVTIRRGIFSNKAWTMTVWKDESFLEDFVEGEKHRLAIQEGKSSMLKSKFYRSTRKYSELPIKWEEAERLVEENGVEY